MQHIEKIKHRFLKNNLANCLGCIAANLARVKSFSGVANNEKAVNDLIEESKFFIEWTAPRASLEIQEVLVNLQIQLAMWRYSRENEIIKLAQIWSNKILKLSGLLNEA